ncbi:MAG: hypothetical protein JW730_03975 [Anaerolineales bacterium]|nr:hypothetical protein [Anaerolineales bacterium]
MKHVYVFGAGASAASANTPLGSELVWNYPSNCGQVPPINNGVPDLSEENESFKNFSSFLKLVTTIYPELNSLPQNWDNRGMWVFIPQVEKKHYVDEMLEILHLKRNNQGVELVRKLIFEHLVESSIGNPNQLYKKFISEVLKNSQQQISIISFNFDFLLHEDFEKDVYFDYLLEFNWIDDNRQRTYAKNQPFNLIKPNGSLDWGICPSCNRLYLYFHHMFKNFYDNKRCSDCGSQIQPFIIIPHERYGNIIEPLWLSAANDLKVADKVIIIGYSFPDYDKRVSNFFAKSLNSYAKLEIVNYCEHEKDKAREKNTILAKYNRIFPGLRSEIDIHLDGFEGYLNRYVDGNAYERGG